MRTVLAACMPMPARKKRPGDLPSRDGEVATRMDGKPAEYLRSSTFWVLMVSGPVLWGLVIYLGARIFIPGFR